MGVTKSLDMAGEVNNNKKCLKPVDGWNSRDYVAPSQKSTNYYFFNLAQRRIMSTNKWTGTLVNEHRK